MNHVLRSFVLVWAFALAITASLHCLAAESSQPHSAKWLVDHCAAANAVTDRTAREKYGASESGNTALSAGYCYGYVAGFLSGFSAGKSSPKELHACVPSEVGPAQIARLLEVRMKEKPEFEHVPALAFLMGVLRGTWPC